MTIGRQVALGFTASLAALLLMAVIGTLALQHVASSKNRVLEERAPVIAKAQELTAVAASKAALKRGYLLSGDRQLLARLDEADQVFERLLREVRSESPEEVERHLTAAAEHDEAWTAAFDRLVERRERAGGVEDLAGDVERVLVPAHEQVEAALNEVMAAAEAAVAADVADSEEDKRRAVVTLWTVAALTLALVTAFAVWMTRRIAQQLGALAADVDSAAKEILATVSQQGSGASQQAAAVQQTAATVDELVQTAEEAVDRAQTVAHRAQDSVQVVDEGNQAVEASQNGMMETKEQVEAISRTVAELTNRAELIGEVVRTVESIAAETHLLALNAAIEAARAGDQGRGFAVVAGEVKNLAGQSKAATAKIGGILSDIEQGTTAAEAATEQGTRSSDAGAELIARAGQTIRQLAETISSAATAAEQIAASSRQQAVATAQISDAMRDVNTVMDQNLAAARQSEQTARGLNEAAQEMKLLVGAE